MEVIDYAKYENYIRVGHTATGSAGSYVCSDLADFPTPSTIQVTLSDLDKDPFTDLTGYTHRDRVRNDIISGFAITYNVLSEDDLQYILNRISPQWIYIELIDKKTKTKVVHKVYASDKTYNTYKAWVDENDVWHEESTAFSVTFVEE